MTQLLILLGDAALVGGLILLLFWLRRRIGLQSLFVAVGALQYLQVVLAASVYVQIFPDIWVSPGSAALFPASIFAVLLIYIEDDASQTRALAYSLVISNVVLFAISTLAAQHLAIDGSVNVLQLPAELFRQNSRIVVAGTVALFVDIIGVIAIFELISQRIRRPFFLRLWFTMLAVMALDSAVFATGAFLGTGSLWTVMVSGFVGKAVIATFYSVMLVAYARFVEVPGRSGEGPAASGDVFDVLTYRQRYEEAQQRATRDALTGLFNRGYFDETLPKHIAQARRVGTPMSLVLIDGDGLKKANDRFGHQAGDRLLRFIAQMLKEFVRESDTACRIGGDEFAVLLASGDGRAARIFADRLLDRIVTRSRDAAPPFPWGTITVTIGIATLSPEIPTPEALIAAADAKLYEGKRAGGACVVGGTPAELAAAS